MIAPLHFLVKLRICLLFFTQQKPTEIFEVDLRGRELKFVVCGYGSGRGKIDIGSPTSSLANVQMEEGGSASQGRMQQRGNGWVGERTKPEPDAAGHCWC